MACWECLLLPQCVFTEPNSFLGRNGASLRNMCTTHLLLRTPKQTHTHTHSLRLTQKTYNTPLHRRRRRRHHHQTTNQTSGIWGLAVVQARMQAGDTIKQQQHAILPPVWLEWMKKKEKNKHLRGAYCDRLNECTRFLEWTASWCFEGLCVVLRERKRLMNVSKAPCEQVCEAESGWSLPG